MKKFSGFTDQQNEQIARKLGYGGTMDGFQNFLGQNPAKAARLQRMTDKARSHVEGQNPPKLPIPSSGTQVNNPLTRPAVPFMPNQPQGDFNAPTMPMPTGAPQSPVQPAGQFQLPTHQQPPTMPSQPQPAGPMAQQTQGMGNVATNPSAQPAVGIYQPMGLNSRERFEQPKITGPDNVPVQYMSEGGWVRKTPSKPRKTDDKPRDNDLPRPRHSDEEPENTPRPPRTPNNGPNAALNQSQVSDVTKATIKNPETNLPQVGVTRLGERKKELIQDSGNVVNKTDTVQKVRTGEATEAEDVDPTKAHTVKTDLAASDVKAETKNLKAEQGTVSEQAQVEAATALPSFDATVQGQLTKLYESFEGGKTPPWAAGAMRMANAAMASRGLGSSSMAGDAITQAAMESAIAIAAQDAATFSQFEMQNLNNRQQARLANAQAFLQMDLTNLSNRQQTSLFKSQMNIQALFTDQAAENASRQFNASSQNQTDQFFANLKAQVDTFNASQKNAMSMFNAEQGNAVKMFNVQQRNDIKKFNANNRLIIDQANVKWRQQISTINNANQNEANRINAQNATNLTLAAYNNLWQQERDLMAYAFTASENATQRAHEVVLAKMGVDLQEDLADQASSDAKWGAFGKLAGEALDWIFD